MREQGAGRIVPLTSTGRTYATTRRARFGDVGSDGRLRLDAVAAYLQDVSSDDTADAGLGDDPYWVVRRSVIEVHRPGSFRELLTLRTACSGVGSRWAERRVSITGQSGRAPAWIEAATVWVRVDPVSGRPAPLEDRFVEVYADAAGGREVHARLVHEPRSPAGAERQAWATRHADLDPLGHVNNAVAWAMVEELLAGDGRAGGRSEGTAGLRAEVEFRRPIEAGDRVELAWAWADGADGRPAALDWWAVDPADAAAPYLTGQVRALDGDDPRSAGAPA